MIETQRTHLRELGSGAPVTLREYQPLIGILETPGFYYAEFKKGAPAASEIEKFIRKYQAFQQQSPRPTFGFVAESKTDARIIGFAEIENIDDEDGMYQGAFGVFVAPDRQRHGFALEITNGVLKWAFQSLKLNRIKFTIDPLNMPSRLLFTRNFPLVYAGLCDNPYIEQDGVLEREVYYLDRKNFRL